MRRWMLGAGALGRPRGMVWGGCGRCTGVASGRGQGQKWWAGADQAPTELMQLRGQLSGPGRHNLSSPGVALGSTRGFRQETQTRSQKHMSFWRRSHQVLWSWPGRGAYLWGEVQGGGRECWRGQGSEHQGLHPGEELRPPSPRPRPEQASDAGRAHWPAGCSSIFTYSSKQAFLLVTASAPSPPFVTAFLTVHLLHLSF